MKNIIKKTPVAPILKLDKIKSSIDIYQKKFMEVFKIVKNYFKNSSYIYIYVPDIF